MQGGTRELAKSAQCILELELIRKEADLSGIHVIDNETHWIVKAGEDILNNASRMLLQGMETQNQAEVAAALQVFYNLGNLKAKVNATVATITERASDSIKNVLTMPPNDNQSRGTYIASKVSFIRHSAFLIVD